MKLHTLYRTFIAVVCCMFLLWFIMIFASCHDTTKPPYIKDEYAKDSACRQLDTAIMRFNAILDDKDNQEYIIGKQLIILTDENGALKAELSRCNADKDYKVIEGICH